LDTLAGYQTGANNRLLADGTYNYSYDDEGNRTYRTNIATGEVVEYTRDHRNRTRNGRWPEKGATIQE